MMNYEITTGYPVTQITFIKCRYYNIKAECMLSAAEQAAKLLAKEPLFIVFDGKRLRRRICQITCYEKKF